MRIVIAEDSVLLREGMARLLSEAGDEVVACVGDGPSLIAAATNHHPDVAIVDIRMPPTFRDEGLQTAIALRRQIPDCAILVLSQYVEGQYANELLETGAEGIGYLLKDRVAEVVDFVASVHRVAAGGTVFDPDIIAQMVASKRHHDLLDMLTPREREVLSHMAEGRSNQAIAERLVITEGSVEKYVSTIFTKLGLAPTDTENRRVLAVLTYLRA